jgi:hypothetical protein
MLVSILACYLARQDNPRACAAAPFFKGELPLSQRSGNFSQLQEAADVSS